MLTRARVPATVVCSGICAFVTSPAAQPQPNYLVPLPQNGTVISLNNSGQR
jgi:hypothetical protein